MGYANKFPELKLTIKPTYTENGYRPNKNTDNHYLWIAPEEGQMYDYSKTDAKGFATLGELAAQSGLEKNGIKLDYDIFMNLSPPDPEKPHGVYHAVDLDFTLNPKSRAVNAGVTLPNVNDNFQGKAPDLGAIESGEQAPVYGPRGNLDQPFYR